MRDTADGQALNGDVAQLFTMLAAFNGSGVDRVRALPDNADAQAPVGVGALLTLVRQQAFNGSGWDRVYNNQDVIVLASALRSANGQTADLVNQNAEGLHLVVNITALAGTSPTLTVVIEAKDPASGVYYTVLSSAALAAAATTILRVYPSLAAVANLTAQDRLPRTWRVRWVIGGSASPSVTFSAGAAMLA